MLSGGPTVPTGAAKSENATASPTLQDGAYDQVFERAERLLAIFVDHGRPVTEPPAPLLAALAPLPGRRDVAGVPFLVRWLVHRSHAARFREPDELLHWALMARVAADSCSTAEAGSPARLADLRAMAWSQFGTALRVRSQRVQAEQAMAQAHDYFAVGTGDPSLENQLLLQSASLLIGQGRFADAIHRAEQVEASEREIGDAQQRATALILKANASIYAGDYETAVEPLTTALRIAREQQDRETALAAIYNRTYCYVKMEKLDLALSAHLLNKRRDSLIGAPVLALRQVLQEGVLLREIGQFESAEASLSHARNGFLARGLAYDEATAAQDLAILYKRWRQLDKLQNVVEETIGRLGRTKAQPHVLVLLEELRATAA